MKATFFKLQGFNVSSLPPNRMPTACTSVCLRDLSGSLTVPLVIPSSTPIIPHDSGPEVVIFVGMPSTGKSSFYHKYFKAEGYVHINQDTIGTRAKCVKAVEETIKDGKSCVIGMHHSSSLNEGLTKYAKRS